MQAMRPLTSQWRLQGLSVEEIAGEFEDVAVALSKRYKFNGRKLKAGPLLNAVVLVFLEMKPEEREELARASLGRLEAFLAESDEERAEIAERFGPACKIQWKSEPIRLPKRKKGTG